MIKILSPFFSSWHSRLQYLASNFSKFYRRQTPHKLSLIRASWIWGHKKHGLRNFNFYNKYCLSPLKIWFHILLYMCHSCYVDDTGNPYVSVMLCNFNMSQATQMTKAFPVFVMLHLGNSYVSVVLCKWHMSSLWVSHVTYIAQVIPMCLSCYVNDTCHHYGSFMLHILHR
jgi:hypothetical protein